MSFEDVVSSSVPESHDTRGDLASHHQCARGDLASHHQCTRGDLASHHQCARGDLASHHQGASMPPLPYPREPQALPVGRF